MPSEIGKPGPNWKQVGPDARKKLSPLIRHYMKKPHPFTSCVRDNTKRFGKDRAERVCAVLKDLGHGGTDWRKGGKRKMQEAVEDALLALHEAGVRDAHSVALIEEFMLSQLEPEDRLLVEGQQLAEAHIEGAARGSAGSDPFPHELDEAQSRVVGYARKGVRGKLVRVKPHERERDTLYPDQRESFRRSFERPTLYPDPNEEFRRRQAAERAAVRDTSSMQDWAAEQARKRREGGATLPPPPASPGTGKRSATERILLDNPGVAPLYGQETRRAAAQRLDDLGLGKYDAVADTFTKVAPPRSPGTGASDPSKVAVGDEVTFSVALPASARSATRRDFRPETGKVVGVTKSGYRIESEQGDTITVPKARVQNLAAKRAVDKERQSKYQQERDESTQLVDELKPGDDIEFSNEDTGFARERGRVKKVTKSMVTIEMTDPIDGDKYEFQMRRKMMRDGLVRRPKLSESAALGAELARAHAAGSAHRRGSAQPVPFS